MGIKIKMKKKILKMLAVVTLLVIPSQMVLAQGFDIFGSGSSSSPYGTGSTYRGTSSGLGASGLGSSLGTSGLGSGSGSSGITIPQTGLPNNSNGIAGVLTNVLKWLLAIVGTLAIIAFVVSGIQYLVSAGDEKSIETAKRNLTYSIVGVVVALSGLIILTTINMVLSGQAPSANGGTSSGISGSPMGY